MFVCILREEFPSGSGHLISALNAIFKFDFNIKDTRIWFMLERLKSFVQNRLEEDNISEYTNAMQNVYLTTQNVFLFFVCFFWGGLGVVKNKQTKFPRYAAHMYYSLAVSTYQRSTGSIVLQYFQKPFGSWL